MTAPRDRHVIHEGRHLRFARVGQWEYVERVNAALAVVIVAETDDGRVLFVEQFRPPVGKPVIELPAGLVGDDSGNSEEPILEAARRELLEETGYEAARLEIVAQGPVSPGLSTETIALVHATGLERRHEGGGIDSEDITVHAIPREKVRKWLLKMEHSGTVAVDPKVYAGLYFLDR